MPPRLLCANISTGQSIRHRTMTGRRQLPRYNFDIKRSPLLASFWAVRRSPPVPHWRSYAGAIDSQVPRPTELFRSPHISLVARLNQGLSREVVTFRNSKRAEMKTERSKYRDIRELTIKDTGCGRS